MAKPTYIVPNLEEWLSKFEIYSKVKVRYSETDMSGHVNNISYLIYLEQARAEYLDSLELGSLNPNAIVVTADVWCHYHAEAFYSEELDVGVRVARIGNSSIDLEYCIQSTRDRRLVVTGAGTIVIVDKQTKKPLQIPEAVRDRIEVKAYKP